METITCGPASIKAEEIEQTGGHLNETTDFDDKLYRDAAGRYYLKEERTIPIPQNARYSMPRDREWLKRMEEEKKTSVREISEKEALLWCVDSFLNDDQLRDRLTNLIEGRAI